jgi:tetratricopeptide (TPR) repeat protein
MASDGPGLFGAYESAAAALESAPDMHGRARLAADHAMARAIWGRNEEALAQAERALVLADAAGDLGARGLALNARGCVRSSAGSSEEALRDHKEALDLAHSYGTPQDLCRATLNVAVTLGRTGRDEEALAL